MYALILMGYVINGAAPQVHLDGPKMMEVGQFADEAGCNNAIKDWNPAVSFKGFQSPGDFRYALMCLPKGK
jgi:hypothetical protein